MNRRSPSLALLGVSICSSSAGASDLWSGNGNVHVEHRVEGGPDLWNLDGGAKYRVSIGDGLIFLASADGLATNTALMWTLQCWISPGMHPVGQPF